jgi:multiple sugar transport system substrate-binding protein
VKKLKVLLILTIIAGVFLAACQPETIIETVVEEVEVEVSAEVVDYGDVVIYSTQAVPVEEAEKMRGIVLADFLGTAEFVGMEEINLMDRVLAEAEAAEGSADVLISLHGTYPNLVADDTLMDLSDLMSGLQDAGIPPAFVELGKKLGFPAGDGGLMHRFLEGYIYPSYTGGMVSEFRSDKAVTMFEFVNDMWQYVNPQSVTYSFMQEQLLSEEVWVAFDHTARLIEAFKQKPEDFIALPAPSGPEGLGFMPVIVGISVPKNAPNPEGAKELIKYMLQDQTQIHILREIGFFPAIGIEFPGFISAGVRAEGDAVAKQAASPVAIPSLLPVGLGTRGGEINKIFRDAFTRIVIDGGDILTVLAEEGGNLETLLIETGAPCWPPDAPSEGACPVK